MVRERELGWKQNQRNPNENKKCRVRERKQRVERDKVKRGVESENE